MREHADETAAGSKYFAESLRAGTGCIGTPDPVDPLIIGPADGAAPILVIGTSGDPATPYDWSVALADSLSSAVLFTVEAEGHTAFLTVECVEPVVTRYLVDLEMPAAGESCSDNATADFFPPAGESDAELIIALFDCLRENGADVPELTTADVLADPTGEKILAELDLNDPAFAAAVLQCQDIIEPTVSVRRSVGTGARYPQPAHSSRDRCPQDRRESHIQSALTLHRDAGS